MTVRNFRGVSEATVTFPEGRLLVIAGPNEAGKSSIVEAIGLLFDYPAESTAEEVRRVRPVGRDADPEVELEFTTGDSWCRYRKVFGRRGTTELEVRGSEPRRFAGREAHDEVRRILRQTTDEALMRALRVLQGESLVPPEGLDGSAALQRALDAGAADVAGENLFERARRECLRYYTERAWRETGELREARDKERDARRGVEHVQDQLAKLEELARRVIELEPRAAALREEVAALRGRREELEAQLAKGQEALLVAALARKKVEAARERQQRLEEAVERRAAGRRRADDLEAELARTEAELETGTQKALEAKERASAAREWANAAQAEAERLDREALLAEQDYSHLQEELQLEQMADRLRQLDEAEQRGAEARAFLDSCRIGPDQLAAVETAEAELRKTEAQLRMAAAQVEVEGPAGATVFVDGAAMALTEKPLKLEAAEERQIELPGGFVVLVRPSVSQGKLEERLAERRERLEGLLRELGARSVEEARELERRRQEAERDIAAAGQAAKAALRDLRDRDDLAGRIERTRARVEAYRAAAGGRRLPATVEEARKVREAGGREREAARRAAAEADRAARVAVEQAVAADREVDALRQRVKALREQLGGIREELAKAERELPTAQLDADLAAARGEVARALAEQEEAAAAAEALAAAAAEAEAVGQQIEGTERQLAKIDEEMTLARGALRHEGEGTLQAELDEALSGLVEAETRLLTVEGRAKAAKLLFETLERHREAARRVYGPRLEERVATLGRAVFGSDFALHLDGRLAPSERTLGGERLPLGQLSIGAREQIAVLYRAACAAAAGEGGVPFFLDDALGWSDEGRLARMAEVLAELAKEVQVVVLTCQPGRFAAAGSAEVVRIEGGRTGGMGSAAGGRPGSA